MRFTHQLHRLKKLLQSKRKTALVISILFLFSSFFVAPAFAVTTVTGVTSVAISGQGILPNSPMTALLRVQVTFASGDSLTGIEVAVNNYSGAVTGDINELAIYKDTNENGVFDSGDTMIAQKSAIVPTLGTAYGGTNVWDSPFISQSHDSGAWYYFIVIKTSGSVEHADAFQGQFIGITGSPSGSSGIFSGTTSNIVQCESKVVDIYYTESDTSLRQTWDLVANDTETYWQPNRIPYSIAREMTEPNENIAVDTPHVYFLSEASRYSFLDGSEDTTTDSEAYSNFLKFERRRKLMGMNVKTPVLGIKVAGKNQFQPNTSPYYDNDYFDTMVITFTDTNGNFSAGDMLLTMTPSDAAGSGVAVYKDINGNHIFDDGTDQVLNILSSSWSGNVLTINFKNPMNNTYAAIPQVFDADLYNVWDILETADEHHDTTGVDFFVVLQAKSTIAYGADFTAQVTGMSFWGGQVGGDVGARPPAGYSLWYETRELKAVYELSDYTGTRNDPSSTFPVMGINVNRGSGSSEKMKSFAFYLKETDTDFIPATDLAAIGGVSVLNRSGVIIPTTFSAWTDDDYLGDGDTWAKTTVTFSPTVALPDDDVGVDSGPDYFINLTTSSSFGYNKKIVASIPDSGFTFNSKDSAVGTVLTTNANVDHGSNRRVFPEIKPAAPVYNPILGNPAVVFSQTNDYVAPAGNATEIIGIDLASNTSLDTQPVLKSLIVQVVGAENDNLAAMTTDSETSGIGVFDGSVFLPLAFPPTKKLTKIADTETYERYLVVLDTPIALSETLDGNPDVYVTLKTNPTITPERVTIRLWGSEIKPSVSYGLGFRAITTSLLDDSVTDTEAVAYVVTGPTASTLPIAPALGGLDADYSQNWYLVVTEGASGAIGAVRKILSYDSSGTPTITCENLIGLGAISKIRVFKVDSSSYNNNFSAPVAITIGPPTASLAITPAPVGNTAHIALTDLSDPDTQQLTIRFYYATETGTDTTFFDTTYYSAAPTYPDVIVDWNTTLLPDGNYRFFALITDGSSEVVFPAVPDPFTVNHPSVITIVQPSTAGLTPTGDQYTITWTTSGLDETGVDTVSLYYDINNSTGGETLIISGLAATLNSYSWDTGAMASGTYYIKGVISDGTWQDTDYSVGTVTISNSPVVTGLTITPSPVGNTGNITLSGLSDPNSDDLTVEFYYTDDNGLNPVSISGPYTPPSPYSLPYPATVTYGWDTTLVPDGDYLLFARISDGVNTVIFPAPVPPALGGTAFTIDHLAGLTGTTTSQVIANQGILPDSPLTALLGLNLQSTAGINLDTVTVTIVGVDGESGFGASDLAEVALYRDSQGPGVSGDGVFDSGDVLLGHVLSPSSLTVAIPASGTVPVNDTLGNAGIDYFIVVRTSDTITHHDAFYATGALVNGLAITGVYNVSSGVVRCECKVADVYYTGSYHLEAPWLSSDLVLDLYNRYWTPNYLSYSIRTEMTEPNEDDPAGDPHAWYLTDTGNYRYSYITGGPSTTEEFTNYTYAYSDLLKFERKRQLLQMQVPTAVLGIKVAGKNQFQSTSSGYYDGDYLDTLVIDFTDTDSANFNARDMLFPLNTADETQSGVALYRDNNHNGVLDAGDEPVPLYNNSSVAQWTTANQLTLDYGALLSDLSKIPQTYDVESAADGGTAYEVTYLHDRTGTDFLVVIRARPQTTLDSKIKYGADFTAEVTTLTFISGTSLSSATRDQWYPTKEIKAVLELSDYTGSRVDPNSTFPLIGINVVDGPGLYEKIRKITLQLKDEVGFNPGTDISDVLIYQGAVIQSGITKTDWRLVVEPNGSWWETTISAESGLDVPDTDTGLYQGDDYYLVLKTSESFGYLDKITGRILDGGIEFSGTTKNAEGTGLVTNALLPPLSNTRVHWNPFASPATPLPGNVAVKFYDLILTPFLEADPDHPAAILGLELSSNTSADTQPVLKSLVVQLVNTTTGKSYVDMSDLSVMTTDSNTSGLGVWKDNGDGVFDAGVDEALTMAAPPTQYISTAGENYQRFIIVLDEAQPVGTSFSISGHSDYFVTIKAKDSFASDQLLMRLWGSEMKPPASYSLGFRSTTTLLDDNITDIETVTYVVTAKTTTPTSTLTLSPALGGSQSDYSQNWYAVVTGDADTAKGAVVKILGANAGLNIITCEDLSGLGSISQIRVFKLDSTSYQNHSVGIAFKISSSVTLSASSTTSTVILTWEDDTDGSGARTFDIERRVKDPVSAWTKIESNLPKTSSKLTVTGNIYRYTDVPPEIITYEYRVTVKQVGAADVFSNIVSAKLSSYFPYRPTNLGYSVGFGVVELSWDWRDGNIVNESGFVVERKGKNESVASFVAIGSTSEYPSDNFGRYTDRSITDLMLETEGVYDYRVRAFKGTGIWTVYSDYSDPIEVEVLPSSVIPSTSSADGGGGGAVGPLAVGLSALLGWWKRRKRE